MVEVGEVWLRGRTFGEGWRCEYGQFDQLGTRVEYKEKQWILDEDEMTNDAMIDIITCIL
jgi:hypothetical protein